MVAPVAFRGLSQSFLKRLDCPRMVRRRGSTRPAVLLGYHIDQYGRTLGAEIVTHSVFVSLSDIEEIEEPT